MGHVAFAALLDHLAGRTAPQVAAHLEACPACAVRAADARRLLAAGRRAAAAPAPSRRALRRARAIFREAHAPPQVSLLRLVLDSLTRPAPALRRAGAKATRFLRYEGAVTVELQLTPTATRQRIDLHGQLTPADFAGEVVLEAGRVRRTVPVTADGTFVVRGVPKRDVELRIGTARIRGFGDA